MTQSRIATRKPKSVILRRLGIRRGSGSWVDYEKAKSYLDNNVTWDKRDEWMKFIVDYIGV